MLLHLLVDTYIKSSPMSKTLVQNVGDSVKLNCSSSGPPLPKVQWVKDGNVISAEGYNVTDLTVSKFTIPSFKPSDTGFYTLFFI